jgi:hypothetical protein
MTSQNLHPPEEVPAFLAVMAAVPHDQPYSRSSIHRTKDGSTFEVEVT